MFAPAAIVANERRRGIFAQIDCFFDPSDFVEQLVSGLLSEFSTCSYASISIAPSHVVGVLAKRSGPVRLSRVARPPLRSVVFFLKMPFRLKNALVLMTDGRASPRRTICGSRGEHWPNLFHEYRTAS